MMGGPVWILIKVLAISALFILTVSRLSTPARSENKIRAKSGTRRYLKEFKERRKKKIQTSKPIYWFGKLPDDLKLEVLSYASERDGDALATFRALLRVDKRTRYMTLKACLPLLPITLTNQKSIHSFYKFSLDNKDVRKFIHHLWIAPLVEEDIYPSCMIIKRCRNLRSLACTARILAWSICPPRQNQSPGSNKALRYGWCTRLTVLLSMGGREYLEASSVSESGAAFFGQLTHLRVMGGITQVPETLMFTKLTHLSYEQCAQRGDSKRTARELVMRYPGLKSVVATSGGRRTVWSVVDPDERLTMVEYIGPRDVNEIDIWCQPIRI